MDAAEAKRLLSGVALLEGYTHGKRMLFEFERDRFLEIHLGLTGSLHREPAGFERTKHDHLVLEGNESALVFRDPRQFGKAALHRTKGGLPDWWLALPPEPHSPKFTRKLFDSYCERKKGSLLKAFMLQQDCFPGVGNWMADEILWRARIRPDRRVANLEKEERSALFRQTRWVCREAIRIIGTDYSDPPESWLFSHRWRDGGLCPKTNQPLVRSEVAGRTTCWSPEWQR